MVFPFILVSWKQLWDATKASKLRRPVFAGEKTSESEQNEIERQVRDKFCHLMMILRLGYPSVRALTPSMHSWYKSAYDE